MVLGYMWLRLEQTPAHRAGFKKDILVRDFMHE